MRPPAKVGGVVAVESHPHAAGKHLADALRALMHTTVLPQVAQLAPWLAAEFLVLGNAGSANEGRAPLTVPAGATPYAGADLEDYVARTEFGFATLDRVNAQDGSQWLLTEYTTKGQPVISCDVGRGKSRCRKLDTPAP